MTQTNYLTIDVEDYYQVSAFENIISKKDWGTHPSRVVRNTRKILSLLSDKNIKATFFILGWIAENHPELVKEISDQGHEVGCHSYDHRLVYNLSPEEFREDTSKTKDILENITGKKVAGYRAPSYSITKRSLWALDILSELGFEYDSSIFPIIHDRYGIQDAPRFKYALPAQNMTEYPISTSIIWGRKIPVAGGGYFRLFPYWFTKMALNKINSKEGKPFIFYLHPWEIDPEQPKIKNISPLTRFRHYNNLDKTENRFKNLLDDFVFSSIQS